MSVLKGWTIPAAIAVVVLGGLVVWMPQVAEVAVLATVLFLIIGMVGAAMATEGDRRWLPSLVLCAFAVKLVTAGLRYVAVVSLYERGDAISYHGHATQLVDAWRLLEVPITQGGSIGTRFVRLVASFLYVPYVPSLLGGFLLFATLAFVGQLLFYLAFREDIRDRRRLRLYAIAVFFVPSLVFWPASIGKDSLMILALGASVYGATSLWRSFGITRFALLVGGITVAAIVRPHLAVLLLSALGLAVVFMRRRLRPFRVRRLIILGLIGGVLFIVASLAAERLGIDLENEGIDPFVSEVERRTGQGGSEIEGGGAISSPAELPEGIITVLFRPFPYETHNAQALVASLEGVVLMALTAWRLPTMVRNRKWLREKPYLLFSLFYTIGFAVAFSAILNFGILARQRTQVLAFLLALVVGLGWDEEAFDQSTRESEGTPTRLASRAMS